MVTIDADGSACRPEPRVRTATVTLQKASFTVQSIERLRNHRELSDSTVNANLKMSSTRRGDMHGFGT